MKRISLRIVLSVFFLLLLLLGVAFSLLATQSGSRWLLKQVPGLSLEGFEGALLSDWRAQQLDWQQEGLALRLSAVQVRLRPLCLLRSALCLDQLEAARIELDLAPSPDAETPRADIDLPSLALPVGIELERFYVGEFVLNGEPLLSDAGLTARWLDDGIYISNLGLTYQAYQLQLKGKLSPSNDWPLQLTLNAQVPVPDAATLQVQGQLSGSVQALTLDLSTEGYVAARLHGQLQALDADLPARLALNIAQFKASPTLADSLTLADLNLGLQGDLQQGYALVAAGKLPNTPEKIQLSVRGVLRSSGAQLHDVRLSASDAVFVALQGALDWQNALQADAQLQWQNFPWHSVLGQEALAVQLHSASGQFSYAAEAYQGVLKGDLTGPAGAFSLATVFSGNHEQLQLSELLIEAGPGRVLGTAQLGFADGVDWLADINLSQLNPAYWLAELPGTLAGALQSQGQWRDGQLQVQANVDLNGELRGSKAALLLDVQGSQAPQQAPLWLLNKADMRFGDNRVTGTGRLDQALAAQMKIDLPRLVQLWPGLAGQADGEIELSGTLAEPLAVAQLTGSGIAYQGHRVGQLSLQAELLPDQRGQLKLAAQRLWSGDTELGVLQLEAQGSMAAHSAELSLQGPALDAQVKLSGGLKEGDWLGQVQQLLLSSYEQSWSLQNSTAVTYRSSGELTLAAHCLQAGASSLCAGEQRLLPQTKIDYRLLNFPLATLRPWLPEDAQIKGQVNGEFKVELLPQGPLGQIYLDAGQGELRVKNNDEWQDFAWQRLRLSSDLTAQAIRSTLQLQGADSGRLEVQVDIDPRTAKKKLRGHFLIEKVDLSALRPFIAQVAVVEGIVEGQGDLAGNLFAPKVTGFVQIRNGRFSGGELPVPFEYLQLRADIKGEQLQLTGGWRSGAKGSGSIKGQVQWAQQLLVDVAVKGEQLPLQVEPYANIEIAPDLHISLKEQRLFIRGEVAVPKGLISIPQLPEQAVQVSPDARVLGRAEPEAGLQMGMDITLNVGAERLRFEGFGLTADLRGNLQVGDNLAGRGMLELLNGRYRAYGQRLELRRARLLFAGPLSQPFLDIEAVRVTGDVTAGLRLTGSAAQPRSEIFSQPAMSQEQALSWLLLGRPLQGGEDDGNVMAQAALALGLMGTAPITNKLADVFGVQDFLLESEGSGLTSSVVASGRISERISLRYGVGVFEPAATLALRYELSKRLYLEAASGLANSLDVFYRRNF